MSEPAVRKGDIQDGPVIGGTIGGYIGEVIKGDTRGVLTMAHMGGGPQGPF